VTREEILAAIRASGAPAIGQVQAVVLETDGSFSVVAGPGNGELDSLRHVAGAPQTASDENSRPGSVPARP